MAQFFILTMRPISDTENETITKKAGVVKMKKGSMTSYIR